VEKEKNHNQPSSSSTSTKKTFIWMGDIMQEIINEVKEGGVQLVDHTTSLLHVIATYVWGFSKVNEVMYPDMVFHCVNDGLGNSVHRMKDWHETILEHGNICKKKAHEWKNTNLFVPIPPFNFPLLKCASYYNCVKEQIIYVLMRWCISEHIGLKLKLHY
jgi:hypothetical protein